MPVSCGKLLWKAENERGSNDNPILLHVLTVDSRAHLSTTKRKLEIKGKKLAVPHKFLVNVLSKEHDSWSLI